MSDKETVELDSGPAVIRAHLYRTLDVLSRDLQQRAKENDGQLSAGDIDAAVRDFRRSGSATLAAISRAAWLECGVVFTEQPPDEDRKAAFERLMVWPFEHLLPAGGEADGKDAKLSRRFIPGYLAAIQELIDPVMFGRFQERCRDLVREVRDRKGRGFQWSSVTADPAARQAVNDVLVQMTNGLETFDELREGFADAVNGAIVSNRDGAGAAPHFGPAEFKAMMTVLYDDLANILKSKEGEAGLIARYGETGAESARDFIKALGRK